MEIPVAPPKCTTTTDDLAESLKCKERCKNAGITVSEYLINNYPPATTSYDENFNSNSATMVPLRNSAFNYLPAKDNNITKDHHDMRIHPSYGIVDDEELKKVRRRIKNKISAQESRRRKKEYMDSLELRLTQKDQEKELLKNRVTELEEKVRLLVDDLFAVKQNNSNGLLEAKLKHQDTLLGISSRPKNILQITRGTQTGTCLQCFMRSRATTRQNDDVEQLLSTTSTSTTNTDDENESRVVPNLVLATDHDDSHHHHRINTHAHHHHHHSMMADEDAISSDEREEDDFKKESADVDILSLSPVSSTSVIVSTNRHGDNHSSRHGDNIGDDNMAVVLPPLKRAATEDVDEELALRMRHHRDYTNSPEPIPYHKHPHHHHHHHSEVKQQKMEQVHHQQQHNEGEQTPGVIEVGYAPPPSAAVSKQSQNLPVQQQQESLISQLMHTEHLLSPSI